MVAANDLVSAIGLDCIGMFFGYTSNGGKDDEAWCFDVFTRCADIGITFWDTLICTDPLLMRSD